MWSRRHRETFVGLTREDVWAVWSDVDNWSAWQDDIEYAHIEGPFEVGSVISLKPKGGPKVRIELVEVDAPSRFVDVTRFPLARMVDVHELIETSDGVELRNTVSMQGPLAFVWRKLVGEDIAQSLPEQTAALLTQVRHA